MTTTAAAPTKLAQNKPVSQSYWSLVWWKFKKNKLAIVGGIILIVMYFSMVVIPEFISPYALERSSEYTAAKPQAIRFVDAEGKFQAPFVYGLERKVDTATRTRFYVDDTTRKYPLRLFVKGDPYKLIGLIPMNIHLFGTTSDDPAASVFIMGTDSLGRDYFSRIIYGGRLSLMIGLIGQFLTLVLGSVLGAMSGYYGGTVDVIIQRVTEFLAAFPDIPLFMALAAAIPKFWSPILVYFMLTVILAFVRWGGLARQVRGLDPVAARA
jgi:peptide/nickel transport system permease protein